MTLFRRIFIGVSLGFLLALLGMQWIALSSARVYLQRQLDSHAQDAATALGMSLVPALQSGDMPLANIITDPVFDRGFFQSIRIISSKGDIRLEKQLPLTPPDVPRWFTSLVIIEAPTAESLITSDWRQLGRVIVTSHPNFAYLQLWHTTIGFFSWMLATYVIALLLLHRFLRAILRPLKEIETVARAISDRDFKVVERLPKPPELRSVVDAINGLSRKIRKIIDTEVGRANHFRDEAYTDALTSIGNRRSFEEQLASHLGAGPDIASGVIFMIELDDFKAFNAEHGFHQGDAVLQLVGKALAEFHKDDTKESPMLRSRINGATFAVAAFGLTHGEAESLGRELCSAIAASLAEQGPGKSLTFNCGGAYSDLRPSVSSLFALADMAMLQERAQGANGYVLLAANANAEDEKGSQYWKRMIVEAIAGDRFALLAQPVIRFDDNRHYQFEVVGRIEKEPGELVAASQFMPMAVRHNLAAAVDMKLIERALAALRSDKNLAGDVALNLSARSMHDAEFSAWLISALSHTPELARRLIFEIAEFGVARDLRVAGDFVARLRQTGARFAVDNFGLHRLAFAYLQDLKPDYIKLNIALIGDLANRREDQFFISSIVKIAHCFDIMTIANGVDSNDLLPLLKSLGVEGCQGFATGALVRIDR